MTGVEILAVQEVTTGYLFSWGIYLISFVLITIMLTSILIFTTDDIIISLITSCICAAVFSVVPAKFMCPSEYETQYKVIISDEVSMNEFVAKYEIISQEGRIYTVRNLEEAHD